ncbi:N-acetylmuramoyl-L-alanine amidase [Neobacillus niacini]|nr:N-acetylmuramoyl-L-alanine amidase [Neobacillus niacini]
MDAMLSENGFIDNGDDLAKMKDPAWINDVARGHVNGLAKVFNLHRVKKTN